MKESQNTKKQLQEQPLTGVHNQPPGDLSALVLSSPTSGEPNEKTLTLSTKPKTQKSKPKTAPGSLNKILQYKKMRTAIFLVLVFTASCVHKNQNPFIGKWQLVRKSNDQQVVFQYDPAVHSKKYIYWFKDDSTLITQDDDGGNKASTTYRYSDVEITLNDSLHSNTFYFKKADNRLSLKSIYSPFNLEFKKVD